MNSAPAERKQPRRGAPLGYAAPSNKKPVGFNRAGATPPPQRELIFDNDDGHMMTFAPTGAGKGVSFVIPALLSYTGSVIVVDPKGELADVTARARREMGHQVAVLDPFGVTNGERGALNPLDLIKTWSEDAVDDCASLASAIATQIGSKDPFWDERAKHLIAQFILYIASDLPKSRRNLQELWRLLNLGRRDFDAAVSDMQNSKKRQVRQGAGMATMTEPRVMASIITCAQRFVEPFRSDSLKSSMDRTSFDLGGFSRGDPVSIYLVLPPERLRSHKVIIRLWLTFFFTLAFRRKHRPEQPTLFLVDEAAQFGRLDHLITASTLLRGSGVKTWTVWQDAEQLETAYGEEWRTLYNNAATHIAFGAMTPLAAEATATLFDTSRHRLYEMKDNEALLMRRGARARVIRRLNYLEDEAFADLADENPRYQRPTAPPLVKAALKPRIRLNPPPPPPEPDPDDEPDLAPIDEGAARTTSALLEAIRNARMRSQRKAGAQ